MTEVHPSAVVHPSARLEEGVRIGPGVVVEEDVVIGEGTEILAHTIVHAHVRIGRYNRIGPMAVIGGLPQDLKFSGERSFVEIGDHNILREFVTVHRATGEGAVTRIGSHNFLMAYAHVAHNCVLEDHIVVVNGAQFAGHVHVGHHAVVSGLVAVHQHARIGPYAMIGGLSRLSKDAPPFMITSGTDRVRVVGPNLVGLKRNGFSWDDIRVVKEIYRRFVGHHSLEDALEAVREIGTHPLVDDFLVFVTSSRRGVYRTGGKP